MTFNPATISAQRYATKAYDAGRKIPEQQLEQLLTLLRNSPSSVNSQPWHFFVISSDAGKKTIEPALTEANKPRAGNASHIIVFTVRTNITDQHLNNLLEQEARDGRFVNEDARKTQEAGRRYFVERNRNNLVAWESRQAYIALGTLLFGAASLGIDATPIEGFDPATIDETLGLREKGLTSVVLAALGYHSADDFNARLPKSRLPREQIFTFL